MSYQIITIALGIFLGLFLWNNIGTILVIIGVLVGLFIGGLLLMGIGMLFRFLIIKGYISFQENSKRITKFLDALKAKIEIFLIVIIHLLLIIGVVAITNQAGIIAGIILSIPSLIIILKIYSEMNKK